MLIELRSAMTPSMPTVQCSTLITGRHYIYSPHCTGQTGRLKYDFPPQLRVSCPGSGKLEPCSCVQPAAVLQCCSRAQKQYPALMGKFLHMLFAHFVQLH